MRATSIMNRDLLFSALKSSLFATKQLQKRLISSSLHIKGIPAEIPPPKIFAFFKSYGDIHEFATFNEAPPLKNDSNMKNELLNKKRKNYITHERPPGVTAIIKFGSTSSAIMCKEELHWRPFPIVGVDASGKEKFRPMLEQDCLMKDPRNRPITNIIFESHHMRNKLRNWVKRDLFYSKKNLSRKSGVYPIKWEKTSVVARSRNNHNVVSTNNNCLKSIVDSESDAVETLLEGDSIANQKEYTIRADPSPSNKIE